MLHERVKYVQFNYKYSGRKYKLIKLKRKRVCVFMRALNLFTQNDLKDYVPDIFT